MAIHKGTSGSITFAPGDIQTVEEWCAEVDDRYAKALLAHYLAAADECTEAQNALLMAVFRGDRPSATITLPDDRELTVAHVYRPGGGVRLRMRMDGMETLEIGLAHNAPNADDAKKEPVP